MLTIDDLAAQLQPLLQQRSEITAAFVFGSIARGTGGPLSDIDIAVFLDETVFSEESEYGYLADLTADIIKV